jgi:hypothetical protein
VPVAVVTPPALDPLPRRYARAMRRYRHIPAGAAVVAAACLVTTACGSSNTVAPGTAALRVTLRPRGDTGPSTTWTVACPDAARAAACQRLVTTPNAFTPPPPTAACSMIYGGPETLTVTGTLGTRRVDYRTGRTNGCEIADYTRDLALVMPFRPTA